jgi:hypothetical protein
LRRLKLSIARTEFWYNRAAADGWGMELIDYAVRIADSPSRGEVCPHFLATSKALRGPGPCLPCSLRRVVPVESSPD